MPSHHAPIMNKSVKRLIQTAKGMVWPLDEPNLKTEWTNDVRGYPGVLRRAAEYYQSHVSSLCNDLQSIGNAMIGMRYGGPEAFQVVKEEISGYYDGMSDLILTMDQIRAIINVSDPETLDRESLRTIARSDLAYANEQHDIGDLLAIVNLWQNDEPDDWQREIAVQIGYHIASIGEGGANIMSKSGPTQRSSLNSCFAQRLKDFFEKIYGSDGERMEVEYRGGDINVCVDGSNIHRGLYNLAINAKRRGRATKFRISASMAGPVVEIECADNGNGLFSANGIFEHGKSYCNGKGLGLCITKHIVKAHGGTITAVAHKRNDPIYHDSAYRGAAFTITLPVEQRSVIAYPSYF